MPPHAVRLVLADHQVLFRQALTSILVEAGWMIVGIIDSGENLEALLLETQATLLIIDRALPGISISEFCALQVARDPKLQILLLEGYESEAQAMQLVALRAGAAGCLSKDHAGEYYLTALDTIAREITLFKNTTIRTALKEARSAFVSAPRITTPSERLPPPLDKLTPREIEILALIADGQPNPEIAERLSITDHTVMKHVSNIINKLNVRNRMEAGILYLKIMKE
jgi:DNA-binding NarL/FixJ family response regulator